MMWGPMMGWGGLGWLWMLFGALLWLIFLVVIAWAVVRLTSPGSQRGQETALEILRRRYARGEISRPEFEEARKALD